MSCVLVEGDRKVEPPSEEGRRPRGNAVGVDALDHEGDSIAVGFLNSTAVATPRVAPFESCIACLRGDTATGFVVLGEAEWIIAFLHCTLGLSLAEASGAFDALSAQIGCEPGKVLDGIHPFGVRCCSRCAERPGLQLGNLAGGVDLPCYRQSR